MKPKLLPYGLALAGLLLILCYLAVSDGRAADAVAVQPPEGSAAEAIVSHARLRLAGARKIKRRLT